MNHYISEILNKKNKKTGKDFFHFGKELCPNADGNNPNEVYDNKGVHFF